MRMGVPARSVNCFEGCGHAYWTLAGSVTLLLDRVLGDAKRLRAQVGTEDRLRLDEYLSVMRSLEERVQRSFDPGLEKNDTDEGRSARNEDRNTRGSEWARGAGDGDPQDE